MLFLDRSVMIGLQRRPSLRRKGVKGLLHAWHYLPKPPKIILRRYALTSSVLRWLNPYEPDFCHFLKRIVRPGWVCVDAGAHTGIITRMIAELAGRTGSVIAFEAHVENAQHFGETMNRIGYGGRVKVENIAASDAACTSAKLFARRSRSSFEWNIIGHDIEGNKTMDELQNRSSS